MKKQRWDWKIDQWFEDKVWTKVPVDLATPHYFFLLGFASSIILVVLLSLILNLLF